MASRQRVRVGDVVTIPLDRDRVALAQVVGAYKKGTYYFAVFDRTCHPTDTVCFDAALDSDVCLLALSMDAKIFNGDWPKVGHRDVDLERIPFPAYIEGTPPSGSYDVVDYAGNERRPATDEDIRDLRSRKVIAPVRLEKAARALSGLEPWDNMYDDLRPPPEVSRSSTRFPRR